MAPYTVKWTSVPSSGRGVMRARQEFGVWSVCQVAVVGQDLLASGSEDETVPVWDPATGASLLTIPTPYRITAVHEVATLLAIGYDFGVLVMELDLST